MRARCHDLSGLGEGLEQIVQSSDPLLNLLSLLFKRPNLAFVGPPQDEVGLIVDGSAVILLMSLAAADLARDGHGRMLRSELLHGFAPHHGGAGRKFGFEPVLVGRVRVDIDDIREGAIVPLLDVPNLGADTIVDELALEVRVVDVVAHDGVVHFRNNERQGKSSQYAFGGAFPFAIFLPHLKEFSGER